MKFFSLFLMAPPTSNPKASQNNSKRPRSTDSDDMSENEHSQPAISSASPRFLVISSTEERSVSSLSPFVIEKVLNGIAGVPKSIKKLRSGDLLVEYVNKKQIENLLRLDKFFDLKVKVSLHGSLNSCKGVVRCPDLKGCSDQEILENMREQGVIGVRRIKVRRDGTLKDTNTFVFTFNTSVLPKQLKVAFLRVPVDAYIPNPLRCYRCQLFGHHEDRCKKETICANCGQPQHCADETDCKNPAKCYNCKEDHPANSRHCQAWLTEKEILKVKYTRNVSFPEARKIVDSYTAAPGKSYASITKAAGATVSLVDAMTQTDPVLITPAPQSSSYNTASTEASAEEKLSQKEKAKQQKADKKLEKIVRDTIVKKDKNKQNSSDRPPDPKSRGKEKHESDREPKGSNDPIRQHNRWSAFEDMDAEESPSCLPRGTLNRIPTS
ncbi:MAG: hypothetical protein ABW098_20625 [Candidatus Thiodiazotropha sp.]